MKIKLLISLILVFSTSVNAGRRKYVRPVKPLFSNSRSCCSLSQDPLTRMIGVTRGINYSRLDQHIFQNKDLNKEGNGLVYTCKSGYIDLTHLRDNADWTLESFRAVKKYLGTGKSLTVSKEGATRKLILNKSDIEDLSREDKIIIAANIAYENSVWHEIATGFRFVSFQHMSAFSPEDNFSNYLGTHIAKEVLKKGIPFNTGITNEIEQFLIDNENYASGEEVLDSLALLKGVVWKYSGVMTDLIIRNPKAYGKIRSFRTPDYRMLGCSAKSFRSGNSISVESTLSNGKEASDYFDLKVNLTKAMKKKIVLAGASIRKNYITEKDHKWLIPLTINYINMIK